MKRRSSQLLECHDGALEAFGLGLGHAEVLALAEAHFVQQVGGEVVGSELERLVHGLQGGLKVMGTVRVD